MENIVINSKKKTDLTETDRGKEIYNYIFQDSLNKNSIKLYSKNSSYGAVFAERFNRTIRDLLKRPLFEKGDANWIDVLPTITKQYNSGTHSSIKLTPIQASLKKNEGFVFKNLLDKRKKLTPRFQKSDLVRTVDLKKRFRNRIRLIGLIKSIKLLKLLMIQPQLIKSTIYQKDITNR